jgi:hypothetical protein
VSGSSTSLPRAQASFTSLSAPTQQAIVPSIVTAEETSRANAIVEMASNVARLVGAPVGGALLPVLGLHGLAGRKRRLLVRDYKGPPRRVTQGVLQVARDISGWCRWCGPAAVL